jgi:pyruvate dehydrogenase E1 component alpha subunit
MSLSKEFKKSLLERMKLIRFVEEGIAERYPAGTMRCPTHLSIGQEAAAAGVAAALQNEDLAISTHRAHAHYIAKGGNIRSMLAEIYGKAAGCCGGRGGSMHLIDRTVGFMGSTAIVGNSIPVGVGLGLSIQLKKTKQVAITYFGDGATEEGAFYESVNFAVVRKLPVLFLCENNFYSVYSPLSVRQPAQRKIYEMAAALGLETAIADGNNIEKTYAATAVAVEKMRNGGGPFFLELTTYRWREHCGPSYDNHIGYRTTEEFEEWKMKDPIYNYEQKLLAKGDITENELSSMNQRVLEDVNSAFDFAENAPFPVEEFAYTGLYATNQ